MAILTPWAWCLIRIICDTKTFSICAKPNRRCKSADFSASYDQCTLMLYIWQLWCCGLGVKSAYIRAKPNPNQSTEPKQLLFASVAPHASNWQDIVRNFVRHHVFSVPFHNWMTPLIQCLSNINMINCQILSDISLATCNCEISLRKWQHILLKFLSYINIKVKSLLLWQLNYKLFCKIF